MNTQKALPMDFTGKLRFPQIDTIELYKFSLYTLQPTITINIPKGVFCLAGANGLGKSTFLSAVNFALTGMVPDPKREFKSVDEYYRYGKSFSSSYFTGRVAQEDRDEAQVSISLQINSHRYAFTRGVFEPDELRSLTVVQVDTEEILYADSNHSSSKRNQEYQEQITLDVGLNTFSQFVFLQHFVLTFDESRHLLLWDDRVLNQVLYLSIGADYAKAQKADKLRRDMEKADSNGRNYNYQASNVRGRIESIREAIKGPEAESEAGEEYLEELDKQHKVLAESVQLAAIAAEEKREQLNDAHLKFMEVSAELTSLQNEYSKEFARRISRRSRIDLHPVITSSLSDHKCAICGSMGEHVYITIKSKIGAHACPLCDSTFPESLSTDESIPILQEIDKRIVVAKQKVQVGAETRERAMAELKSSEDELESARLKLKNFEAQNEKQLLYLINGNTTLAVGLRKLQEEMADLIRQKNSAYAKRDEIRTEMLVLQRELQQRYYDAETRFVPLVQEYASLFLGMDLQIRMNASTTVSAPGISLAVEIRDVPRRRQYQLSESQRFFLDIALRMALAQFMSSRNDEATLFIDTPEGALDIAYESRAGEMFAKFSSKGYNIIMTANINSSQLLRRLARECGNESMTLHKMTSWTGLSDVQMIEEDLFHEAYSEIERELAGPNAKVNLNDF